MRALFTAMPAPSHLRSVAPTALALQRHGHEVVVAAPAFQQEEIASYQLAPVLAGAIPHAGAFSPRSTAIANMESPDFGSGSPGLLRMFAGERVLCMAKDILALAKDLRPDLIVRDVAELGGYLAAEVLAIPHVSITSVGRISVPESPLRDSLVAALIDGHRKKFGLSADPEMKACFRFLHVNLMPAAYDPAVLRVPNARCYRQTNPEQAREALPAWIDELPDDRPIVFASLGTRFHNTPGRLDVILSALSTVRCSAVVAIGAGKNPGKLPPAAGHIRLVEHVPQPLFLQCCDLFVTHGGFNSVRESLRLGVPMVINPVALDQPYNAQRCAELGLAIAVSAAETSAGSLAKACQTVLAEPGFRRRARAMQRQILALPSLDHLVVDLEGLVRRSRPTTDDQGSENVHDV